ncbi:MAG: NAD(P)-dependent oxidoreductase, partial [Pseudomonadota bacterium]
FQSSAAGTEHPILQAIGGKAEIYTSSHAQSDAIAEWVLWVGLDWFQRGGDRRAAQVRRDWKRIEFTEIGDTHWLIVGFGAIGRASAKRLRALGAHVTGVRRTVGPDPNADVMVQPNDLHDCLPAADAVLLCCPLTEETEEMANHDFFQAMKPGAFFANVGRGKLVDEAALLSALDTGQIAHAALDVVAVEPLPENNPIWSHPRITLTSHLAADTMGAARRTDDIFLSNLERFVAQQPLMGVVARSEFAVSPN